MEWMNGLRKTRPIYILSTRDLLQIYRHTQTDNESVEKDIYSIQMKTTTKAGVAILISGKIDFKTNVMRDKEGHSKMIKRSIQLGDIIFVHPT